MIGDSAFTNGSGAVVPGAVDTPIPLPPVYVTAPEVPVGMLIILMAIVWIWWRR